MKLPFPLSLTAALLLTSGLASAQDNGGHRPPVFSAEHKAIGNLIRDAWSRRLNGKPNEAVPILAKARQIANQQGFDTPFLDTEEAEVSFALGDSRAAFNHLRRFEPRLRRQPGMEGIPPPAYFNLHIPVFVQTLSDIGRRPTALRISQAFRLSKLGELATRPADLNLPGQLGFAIAALTGTQDEGMPIVVSWPANELFLSTSVGLHTPAAVDVKDRMWVPSDRETLGAEAVELLRQDRKGLLENQQDRLRRFLGKVMKSPNELPSNEEIASYLRGIAQSFREKGITSEISLDLWKEAFAPLTDK